MLWWPPLRFLFLQEYTPVMLGQKQKVRQRGIGLKNKSSLYQHSLPYAQCDMLHCGVVVIGC